MAIAIDIMTNTLYGLGMNPALIDMTVANATAAYLASKGYGLNMAVKEIGEARQVVNKMIDLCDLIVTIGTDGLIWIRAVIPDPATFAGNTGQGLWLLLMTIILRFTLSRQTWLDVPNEFEGSYSEPGRLYEPTSIIVKNEAVFTMTGAIKKKTIDLAAFTNKTIAAARLQEIMARESYPRMSVTCDVDRRFYSLRPGDLVSVTKAEYGIVTVVFLVTRVTLGRLDDEYGATGAYRAGRDAAYGLKVAAYGPR